MMNAFSSLMPGEHNYLKGKPMPGQVTSQPLPEMGAAPASPMQPQRKQPIMNALSTLFEYGAPEAFQQGVQMRSQKDMRNAFANDDYAGAARAAMKGGNYEAGFKIKEYSQGLEADKRKQEAQGVYQLFSSMQPLQINDYAMQDPAGFERMTGMSSEEYLQSAQQMQQYGMTPEQFHQYVITKAQAELGMESQAPEAYTLAPGARRYDAQGRLIAENPVSEKPASPYSTIGKLAADLQAGRITQAQYDGEVARMQRADPSLSVQFGQDGALAGITYGSAPKGQESAIVRGPGGQPVVSPGPQQEQFRKADNFLRSKQRQIGIVRDDIRRASELVQDPMATGPMGVIGRELPIVGAITPGGRLASRIKTIKTNIGFDKLDEMRQNSPTGGALGNVTEKEIDFLQAVAGELDNAQSDEDVTYILNRIDAFYADLEQQYQQAFALDYPTLADTAQFRSQTNQQVQALTAEEAAELEQLRRELGGQ